MNLIAFRKDITPLSRLVFLHIAEGGYPTLQQLCDKFCYSRRQMYNCINELTANGLISKTPQGYCVSQIDRENSHTICVFKK